MNAVKTEPADDEVARTRDFRLDALKGTAIVLVVLGHALVRATPPSSVPGPGLLAVAGVGWVDTRTLLNPLINVIYTFHIPLFAFVSGRTMFGSSAGHGTLQLRRRFMSLMVPYLAWVIVAWMLIGEKTLVGFSDFYRAALINPLSPGALWFLYALFGSAVIFVLVKSLPRGDAALAAAAVLVGLSGLIPMGTYEHFLGLSEIAWVFPFFVAGYFVGKFRSRIEEQRWIWLVAPVVWILSMTLIWPVTIPGDRWWFPAVTAWFSSLGLPGSRLVLSGVWGAARVACALSAIASVYALHGMLNATAARVQSWLGRHTMGLYAAHGWFLLPLGLQGGPLRVLTLFVTAVTGGILITLLLERTMLTRRVLLGQA